jgi:serine/threonine protein kinase
MSIQAVRLGVVVARRYRATRRIASGAMGEVWEGTHVELGTRVALKVLRKDATCQEMVARFVREAFLLARVQSDHVVRVVDFMRRGRHGPVLVMELLEGSTLADILHHKCLPIAEAVEIAIDLLRGLDALHANNVVHRDVKPANVVLRQAPDGSRRAVLMISVSVDCSPTPPRQALTTSFRWTQRSLRQTVWSERPNTWRQSKS